MSTSVVPIFDPQGVLRDVPSENLPDAVKAGGKPAVRFQAPDKSIRFVPADKTQDAVKAGGTMLPIEQQDVQHPGFWHSLAGDLMGMPKALYSGLTAPDPIADPNVPDSTKNALVDKQLADAEAKNSKRTQEHGAAYSLGASANEMLGVNVEGEEKSAAEGDPGGVLGHAAAMPVAVAATEGAMRGIPTLAKKSLLLGRSSEEAYQSALKPSVAVSPARVERVVQTGLREGIPVSVEGVAKLSSLIDDLNDKITAQIQSDPTRPIKTMDVAQRVDPLKAKFAQQVNPSADLQSIDAAKEEFIQSRTEPPASGIGPSNLKDITAAEAQAMKTGTYRQLRSKAYGEMKTATVEAQKALARGLKEELANAFPELADPNARESQLLDLQKLLEKAVQRQANHQLIGIGTPVMTGATKAVTGSSGAAAVVGALKAVVDNPSIKSRLAIALSSRGVPPATTLGRLGNYSAALAAAASHSNNEPDDDRTDSRAK